MNGHERQNISSYFYILLFFFFLIAAFETNKYVDDIAHFLSRNSY